MLHLNWTEVRQYWYLTEEGHRKSLHWFGAKMGVKIFSTQGNKTVYAYIKLQPYNNSSRAVSKKPYISTLHFTEM